MESFIEWALPLLAGIAVACVVGVAVTELLATRIWPSLLVGIPAGVAAGVVAMAVVRWRVN